MVKTAMILAAGFGTRLKELTKDTPKALIEYRGKPMITHVIERLISFGIEDFVVNCHHFAEQLVSHFNENKYNAKINLIIEDKILGTGGGIKNAERYLKDTGDFIVHNADVISDIDIQSMYEYHKNNNAYATLALQDRDTTRPLIIDEKMNIIGRKSANGFLRYANPVGEERLIGFCGIHFISSNIFNDFRETGFFDIFTEYFRLISEGKKIIGYDVTGSDWKDLGTIESLNS
ncbi:MAG: nucleotidyltransferase family protein [Ignavibacteriae bacterium]|nr:MAG: nucleotidyltransferase family protein [Ignavibacteriota bacterium]